MFGRLQTGRRAVTRHAVAASRAGFDAHEQALTEILLTRVAPPALTVPVDVERSQIAHNCPSAPP